MSSVDGSALVVAIAALLVALLLLLLTLRRSRREVRALRRELHGARVRGGRLAESLAPLAADFPVDVAKPDTATVFLGQPVDYIHFDPEEGVTLIEVKSGHSDLSARQRRLKTLIEGGRVAWKTYRVR